LDQIKQRLAEIDKQLSRGPVYYLNQTITAAPLAFCALGMIAGIILQDKINFNILFWLPAFAFCLVIFFMLLFFIKVNRIYTAALLSVLCFVCLGAIRLAKFNQPGPNDIRNYVVDEPNLATVRGVLATNPYIDGNDWKFARFAHTDSGSSFYLEVRQVESVKGWVNASGLVRVRVNEPLLDLKVGDYIQMYCWLDRFGPATNPGEFDIAKYLARKGVFIGASVDSRQAIEFLQTGQERLLTRIRTRLSAVATQRLTADLPCDESARGLAEALLLGSRNNIGKDVYRSFEETGLLHFISLSGMHLAIIAGIGWWMGKLAGLMKRGQAAVCIITVVLFALTVPPRDPTVRSAHPFSSGAGRAA
jgi:hypothetical protein